MELEWDARKASANRNKHGISFEDAATVFTDPLALTFPDPDHSDEEEREITIGYTMKGQIVVVSHTERDDRIRVINARPATARELRYYEEENSIQPQ